MSALLSPNELVTNWLFARYGESYHALPNVKWNDLSESERRSWQEDAEQLLILVETLKH